MSFAENSGKSANAQSKDLVESVYAIGANNFKIKKLIDNFQYASPQSRHNVTEIVQNTKVMIKDASALLKKFMAIEDSKLKTLQKKISNDFNVEINKFQQLSKSVAQLSRESIITVRESSIDSPDDIRETSPLLQYYSTNKGSSTINPWIQKLK